MASSSTEHVEPADDQPSTSSSAQTADTPSPSLSESSPSGPKLQESNNASANSQAHLYQNTQYPLMFDLLGMRWSPEMVAAIVNQSTSQSPLVPILCPVPQPECQGQLNEQVFRCGGIFAVPMVPVIGPLPGFPSSGLIPVSYNIPPTTPVATSATPPVDRAMPAQAQEPFVGGPLQDGGQNVLPPVGGQLNLPHLPDGQRQIVRRFHVAFQIDLLLILKLGVLVFIFNQDGSRNRLFVLVFIAAFAYLYKTGTLTPLLRRISESAQRAMMPPQQQQPARERPAERHVGQDGIAAADVPAAAPAPAPAPAGVMAAAAANPVAPPIRDGVDAANAGGDHAQQAPPVQRATWWGFLKEVQMIVVGFVTSLLPGFHQHID